MPLVAYNIRNIRAIQEDVSSRSSTIAEFRAAINRKIQIEKEYCCKKKQLAASLSGKIIANACKSSELFLNSIVTFLKQQATFIGSYVMKLEQQIEPLLNQILVKLQGQCKQKLDIAQNIEECYMTHYELMEKSRAKFEKKSKVLRQLKEQYLVGVLTNMSFNAKYKLNEEIKEIERKKYLPLQKEYESYVQEVNEIADKNADTIHNIVKNVSVFEGEKIKTMGTIFMILQILNTEHGNNIMSDNTQMLTKLKKIEADSPDFIDESEAADFKNREEWRQSQTDPCSFMNHLFQQIFSNNSSLYEQPSLDAEIVTYFNDIFYSANDNEEKPNKAQKLVSLMKNEPLVRRKLIFCFEKLRKFGNFKISIEFMPQILIVFRGFLDQCLNERDTFNSKLLMILSLTFYIQDDNKRILLQEFLKDHFLWTEKDWWECTLLESIFEKVNRNKPKKSLEFSFSIWDIKGCGIKHIESEHEIIFHHTIFNELVYFIENMRLFRLSESTITFITKKYAKYFGLGLKMISDIEGCLVIKQLPAQMDSSGKKQKKGKHSLFWRKQ